MAFSRTFWRRLLLGVSSVIGIGWSILSLSHYVNDEKTRALADQAMVKGDFATAKTILRQLEKKHPRNPDFPFLLGRTARRAGELQSAEDHLQKSLELGAIAEAVDLERLLIRAQGGEFEKVSPRLFAYIEKEHPDRLLIFEALVFGAMADFRMKQALLLVNEWLKEETDNARALLWKAQILERLSARKEVVEAYRDLVRVEPNSVAPRLRLAQNLFMISKHEESLQEFDIILQTDSNNGEAIIGKVRALLALGRDDEAEQFGKGLAVQFPDDGWAWLVQAKIENAKSQSPKAEPLIREALKRLPYNREVVYTSALIFQQMGKKTEADELFARVGQIDADRHRLSDLTSQIWTRPKSADLRHEAGVIFLRNGHDSDGLRWLDSALKIDPQHTDSHRALAKYYRDRGRIDLAAFHESATTKK